MVNFWRCKQVNPLFRIIGSYFLLVPTTGTSCMNTTSLSVETTAGRIIYWTNDRQKTKIQQLSNSWITLSVWFLSKFQHLLVLKYIIGFLFLVWGNSAFSNHAQQEVTAFFCQIYCHHDEYSLHIFVGQNTCLLSPLCCDVRQPIYCPLQWLGGVSRYFSQLVGCLARNLW